MDLRKKVIGVPLQKAMPTDDGGLLVRGFFTSDQKDEVGDIITRSATERALPRYKRWGNIRYMHQPKPVGRVAKIGVEDGLEWNEVEIKVIDPQTKFEVESGLLQALSVGILINYQDIDMLEDGGWVINDYQLAEISLVDHPANYDAALETLNLSIDEGLRNKIREQGVVPVLRSIGAVPAEKGERMEENTNPIADAISEAAEQPVVEEVTEVVSETPEVVEEDKEILAEEQPAVEEPVAEETPAEEPVVEEQAAPADPILSVLNSLVSLVEKMQTQLDELAAPQETPAPEADVESTETAKDISGAEDDRVAQLERQIADLNTKLDLLNTPVDRKGALPVEEPVEAEEVEPVEETEEVVKPKSLSEAVGLYMKNRSTRR